jgi:hypothetical protein
MLIVHITLASLGLISSLYSLYKKQMNAIFAAYGFIASGVFTGIALLIFGDASVLRVCLEGLFVSSISLALAITAQRRLVAIKSEI